MIASYLDHRPHRGYPVSAETAARQQQTADLFYENKLVPKVDIRARIWQPTATRSEIMSLNMFWFYRPMVMVVIWVPKRVPVRSIMAICSKSRRRRIGWASPAC
ncbi:Putative aliphatic sulfonates-binding protein [Klebsiella pneumoniae]|nr:Putative aliphatic sulfonates-binding protein [Klebsiella pneumoniae]